MYRNWMGGLNISAYNIDKCEQGPLGGAVPITRKYGTSDREDVYTTQAARSHGVPWVDFTKDAEV